MKLPKISSAFLNITDACNLKCRYCFVKQHPNYMNLQTAIDAADFLAKNAEGNDIPSINFFGGEPLLMWDEIIVPVTDYVRKTYKNNFKLAMTSNCILMNQEKLEYMKKNNVGLLFSLDGDKETNDYNRPCHNEESSFDILKEKIPLILSYHPQMTFRATIIPETCQYTFHNLMFAIKYGYKNVFVVPNTLEYWDEKSKLTLADCMRQYSDYIIQCYRQGIKPPQFSTLNMMFRNIIAINYAISNNLFRERKGCLSTGKCGLSGTRFGAIDYAGNLYGCQEIPTNNGLTSIFYIGDIYNGASDERRLALMNSFNANDIQGDNCSFCKLNPVCDGGCVAHNYLYSNSIVGVSPVYCWWQQTILKEAIYIMQTLGNEHNESFKQFWYDLYGK